MASSGAEKLWEGIITIAGSWFGGVPKWAHALIMLGIGALLYYYFGWMMVLKVAAIVLWALCALIIILIIIERIKDAVTEKKE